jgi:cytochrome c biogenesis protein CcdA
MLASVPSLTSVALLDSMSFIPLCIAFLVVLLAGPRPALRSFALISGVFVAYFTAGALALLGLQEVFDDVNAYLFRMWKSPYTEELILQIAIGAALVVIGWRLVTRRARPAVEPIAETMTASKAWLTGVSLTIAGLPGAVPYLAAVDLLLRTDLPPTQRMLLVAFYNAVFVAPLAAVVAVRLAFGASADSLIDAIRRFLDRWGPKLIVGLMVALGTVLIIDGIGWFLGHPLIPV